MKSEGMAKIGYRSTVARYASGDGEVRTEPLATGGSVSADSAMAGREEGLTLRSQVYIPGLTDRAGFDGKALGLFLKSAFVAGGKASFAYAGQTGIGGHDAAFQLPFDTPLFYDEKTGSAQLPATGSYPAKIVTQDGQVVDAFCIDWKQDG